MGCRTVTEIVYHMTCEVLNLSILNKPLSLSNLVIFNWLFHIYFCLKQLCWLSLSKCVSRLIWFVCYVCFCSINLSRAKRELSQLNQQTSPLLKLLCLRRVVLTATQTPRCTSKYCTYSLCVCVFWKSLKEFHCNQLTRSGVVWKKGGHWNGLNLKFSEIATFEKLTKHLWELVLPEFFKIFHTWGTGNWQTTIHSSGYSPWEGTLEKLKPGE